MDTKTHVAVGRKYARFRLVGWSMRYFYLASQAISEQEYIHDLPWLLRTTTGWYAVSLLRYKSLSTRPPLLRGLFYVEIAMEFACIYESNSVHYRLVAARIATQNI